MYIIYIFSFIIGNFISIELVSKLLPFLDMSSRYSTYVDLEYVTSRYEDISQKSFLNTVLSSLPKYFIFLFMTWLYISKKMFKYDVSNIITKTLSYTLLFCCLCSIAQVIPSMGRFDVLCELFILFLLILYKRQGEIKSPFLALIIFVIFFARIYNIWFIHNDIISYKYLYPFAYLFY